MALSRTSRLAVLASGAGTNFRALADAALRGELGGEVVVLLCDRPGAGALGIAAGHGIPAELPPTGPQRTRLSAEAEAAWVEALRAHRVDTVLLAGFMRILHETFLGAFPGRVLNIHPSLLPAFPGVRAIERAFEHGVRVTGCTVHLVDAGVDSGPILAQEAVPVHVDDTLETLTARVHEAEHRLYAPTVRDFLTRPWSRSGRRIVWSAGGAGTAAEPRTP
jgi:phosphoribosylglycinamide formyltransferase-1